ncbi:proline-rich protein HaeIII subfamily 1-like [Cynocephalus volans]|uniref:proline-rich protein HaeIII subfamily 1-like n=1 Tax=Cynocephalus volans TaxID=110931 RepID=UPI002FCA5454
MPLLQAKPSGRDFPLWRLQPTTCQLPSQHQGHCSVLDGKPWPGKQDSGVSSPSSAPSWSLGLRTPIANTETQRFASHRWAHTRIATQAGRRTRRRRAHTGPRERTPGPPQRRGHTLTRSHAHTRAHTGAPPAASRAAAGSAHPARGGPGPGPAAAASLRAMVGGGPGEGARCRGAASLPPPALPPEPPPSSALRAARRRAPPPPPPQGGRGRRPEGADGRGGSTPPNPPPQDPSSVRSRRRPAPDPSPVPPPVLPASPETPPDHAPTGMGTTISLQRTQVTSQYPRGPQTRPYFFEDLDHVLEPPRPQTMSYSPW